MPATKPAAISTPRFGALRKARAAGRAVEAAVRQPSALAQLMRDPRVVAVWMFRYRSRHELRFMSEARLRDIGVSREEAEIEAAKPFWRA